MVKEPKIESNSLLSICESDDSGYHINLILLRKECFTLRCLQLKDYHDKSCKSFNPKNHGSDNERKTGFEPAAFSLGN
jgi:hypothetical protein